MEMYIFYINNAVIYSVCFSGKMSSCIQCVFKRLLRKYNHLLLEKHYVSLWICALN